MNRVTAEGDSVSRQRAAESFTHPGGGVARGTYD